MADPGTRAERVSRASAVDEGYGAVVISIRSELYLEDTLGVFFLREGGSIANDADVVRFERKQGFLSFGNDTLGFKVRAFQLRPGTYRLVAHGVSCAKVPAEDERCLVDFRGIGGTQEISRPSRGYHEIAPTFEVRAGSVTYAGDYILTARNQIEWAELPREEIERTRNRFARMPSAPEPVIPGEYRLRYGLNARSLEDDWNRRY
ncbi:hypothetical protein [uncultured Erythrobacter sp.]|uniref:hypothetical protein n=1 Tax=uncultured Erythrobacter sp. TaxID=263913 RepID=UPI0026058804|nr:hypothetical protein [uncultured Erythrobacter sp.]